MKRSRATEPTTDTLSPVPTSFQVFAPRDRAARPSARTSRVSTETAGDGRRPETRRSRETDSVSPSVGLHSWTGSLAGHGDPSRISPAPPRSGSAPRRGGGSLSPSPPAASRRGGAWTGNDGRHVFVSCAYPWKCRAITVWIPEREQCFSSGQTEFRNDKNPAYKGNEPNQMWHVDS